MAKRNKKNNKNVNAAIEAATEVMNTENTTNTQEEENMENTQVMVTENVEQAVEATLEMAETVEAVETVEEQEEDKLIVTDESGELIDIKGWDYDLVTLDKSNQPYTVEQIWKKINEGKFVFDSTVQRTNVWTVEQQSLLVHSLISKMPIPSLYANKLEGGVYSFFDGKQRTEAIRAYRSDEFALKDVPTLKVKTTSDDEVYDMDINGKKYSELPDVIQDAFRNASLTVFSYTNDDGSELDSEQESEVFYRMNNGTPLTKIEITRVKAVSYDKIKQSAQHDVFSEMFTEKQRKKYANEDTAMKCFMLLMNDSPCLDNKEVRPFVENVQLTDTDVENMNSIFDVIMDAHTTLVHEIEKIEDAKQKSLANKCIKRLYGRTHFITLVPIVQRAINEGKDAADLAPFFLKFFYDSKKTSISESYNNSLVSGSNHAPSVKKRLDALTEEYEKFFGIAKENAEEVA